MLFISQDVGRLKTSNAQAVLREASQSRVRQCLEGRCSVSTREKRCNKVHEGYVEGNSSISGRGGENAREAESQERHDALADFGRPGQTVSRGEQNPVVERPSWLLSPQRRSEGGSNGMRVTSPETGNVSARGKSAEGINPRSVSG